MKKQSKFDVSRRGFLGSAAALAALSVVPLSYSCSSSESSSSAMAEVDDGKPNSVVGGVKVGTITYSYRSMVSNWEDVINACVDSGISTIELYHIFESEVGAPVNPVQRRYAPPPEPAPGEQPSRFRRGEPIPFTPEEEQQIAAYEEELAAFRNDPTTMDKWAEVRKRFNDAGIDIHIIKWTAGDTDELLDYSFQVAKTLGAVGITMEGSEEACQMLGPAAERNGMLAIYHQHRQYSEMTVAEIEQWLSYSPANRLNLDIGHYFGYGYTDSTGLDPLQMIDHFADKIVSMHIKDKTAADNETEPGQNQVWGQGQTPLRDIFKHVQTNHPHIYCDIELEYEIKPWSNAVKEVGTCFRYAEEILLV